MDNVLYGSISIAIYRLMVITYKCVGSNQYKGKDENNVEEETAFRWPSNTSYATAAMANQCGMKTLPYTTTTHSIPNPAAAVAQMYHHYGIIDGGSLSLNGPVVNVSHHQMYVRPNLIPTNKMIVASQANTLIEQVIIT